MKAYRPVLYASLFVLAVAIVLPLITLRSFQGYVQAWLAFLGLIAPAALLVFLLVLSRRLSPRSTRTFTLGSVAIVAIAWLLGRVNILFSVLFLAGALAIILSSQRTASRDPNGPAHLPPI